MDLSLLVTAQQLSDEGFPMGDQALGREYERAGTGGDLRRGTLRKRAWTGMFERGELGEGDGRRAECQTMMVKGCTAGPHILVLFSDDLCAMYI